ncbi:MAG: L,D-transpeptidase [Gammaproteobacteria bacterium]|nr:L,D-transpeptidase [Gammaproteobacteria bacterium]
MVKERVVEISIGRQRLWLREGSAILMDIPVSTARNGPGEMNGSECTPRGWHTIHAKIGAACPPNTVFVGRKPTGELYSKEYAAATPGRDWILTRILWLEGLEPGHNCGGEVDSRQRYIYIHGTPDEVSLGAPGSRGCVRVRNDDVIRLFDLVEVGTRVLITEDWVTVMGNG